MIRGFKGDRFASNLEARRPASLRRVKALLDKHGRPRASDNFCRGHGQDAEDMGDRQARSLKDKNSAGEDLFGKDPLDMK